MGTRHLICVFSGGEYKIAQYGQWDGYPSGQGAHILQFLKEDFDRELFEDSLRRIGWITEEEAAEQWVRCGADPDSEFVTFDIAAKHERLYPENNRNTGARILEIVQSQAKYKRLSLYNSLDFAGDSLYCEWAYVIDLDKNTFEVYAGFNKDHPPDGTGRFDNIDPYTAHDGTVYHPVRLLFTFDLDDLPNEETFLEILRTNDEDEE